MFEVCIWLVCLMNRYFDFLTTVPQTNGSHGIHPVQGCVSHQIIGFGEIDVAHSFLNHFKNPAGYKAWRHISSLATEAVAYFYVAAEKLILIY